MKKLKVVAFWAFFLSLGSFAGLSSGQQCMSGGPDPNSGFCNDITEYNVDGYKVTYQRCDETPGIQPDAVVYRGYKCIIIPI